MVFLTTRHCYCFWHVRKHIAEQQVPLMNKYGKDFISDFRLWYTSHDKYMRGTMEIDEGKINIEEEEDSWLLKMYRLRGYWVNTYLKDIFCAGMTTSQRSESINFFFNGFVKQTQN